MPEQVLAVQERSGEVVAQQPADLLSMIAQAVQSPAVDVAKMQALLDMKFKVDERDAKIAFEHEKSELQKKLPKIRKDGTIELKKDGRLLGELKYAKFEDIQNAVRPLLAEHGFSLSFDERLVEGGLKEITVTLKRGGHSESGRTYVPMADTGPGRNQAQAMISANSYGKRRALVNILDLQMDGEDDDGNGGAGEAITKKQIDAIEDLCVETGTKGASLVKFLGILNVEKVADILQGGMYDTAVRLLEARRK